MDLTVLISCMYEKDYSIISRSNVQTNAVVINQCDKDSIDSFDFVNKKGKNCHVIFICTTERGLSKSRNMAIAYAPENSVCLICDDDEVLADDVEEKIEAAYQRMPDAIFIAFSLIRKDLPQLKEYPKSDRKLCFRQILQTSSLQISFRKKEIEKRKVKFDEKMGSGTGNGGGEETKFMMDIAHANGRMYYAPECVATIVPGESKWFDGFTEKYFRDRGWSSHRILGCFIGWAYIWYNAITHRKDFTKDGMSIWKVLFAMHRGFFEKR